MAAAKDQLLQAILAAGTRWVAIFGKSWDLHVTEGLKTTLEENLAMIGDTIEYLRSQGRRVIYDAEHWFDGYKHNREYALKTLEAAIAAGAAGVPLTAFEACSAVLTVISAVIFAAFRANAVAVGTPRHAGSFPINTLWLPGPPVNTGGKGCATVSVILAAGFPVGIIFNIRNKLYVFSKQKPWFLGVF